MTRAHRAMALAVLLLAMGCDGLVLTGTPPLSEPIMTRAPVRSVMMDDALHARHPESSSHGDIRRSSSSPERVNAGPTLDPCGDAHGVWIGSFVVESEGDLAALAGYGAITGDLYIDTEASAEVELECVSMVAGSIIVEPEVPCLPQGTLERVSLPRLTTLGGARVQFNASLTEVAMPELLSVAQDFVVENNPELTTFSYPKLAFVDGALHAASAPKLSAFEVPRLENVGDTIQVNGSHGITEVRLPALVEAGGLRVSGNKHLTVVSTPELRGVEEMLRITENANLASIEVPLLESVGGLLVRKNAIDALPIDQLQTVGALGFEIWGNDEIEALDLPSLTHVEGDLSISSHALMASISAPVLASVGETLGISAGPSLASVWFPQLSEVGASVFVSGNAILETLELPLLATVAYDLRLKSNQAFIELDAPALSSVRDVIVELNQALPTFDLPALDTMTGELIVEENESLHTVGLTALASARSLIVRTNPNLETLTATSLSNLDSDLLIENNDALTTLHLHALESITGWGRFEIRDNDALDHFAMPSIAVVERSMKIVDNEALTFFCMPQLSAIGTDESGTIFRLSGNDSLTGFMMPALAHAPRVTVEDNAALESLSLPSLEALDSEFYDLRVLSNGSLTSIAMPALHAVLGDLEVGFNSDLQTLALGQLEEVGGALHVSGNPKLPQCSIDAWVDAIAGSDGIGGEVATDDNDEGCTCTQEGDEVVAECMGAG